MVSAGKQVINVTVPPGGQHGRAKEGEFCVSAKLTLFSNFTAVEDSKSGT